MLRLLYSAIVLLAIAGNAAAAPYFQDTGLVDIPTGKSLEHGIFNVGAFISFGNEKELPREDTAVKVDFGLFERLEANITTLKRNQTSFLLSSFKLQLLKEIDAVPNVAVGVENLGDKVADEQQYKSASQFLVISKHFNLPYTHLFAGHIGIGRGRYVEDESIGRYLHGVFFGVSKDLQPSFARGDISLSVEVDGRGVNAGIRYLTEGGLLLNLAATNLNKGEEIRYLFGVAFTNRTMLKEIEEAKRLARQVGKNVEEAKELFREKQGGDNNNSGKPDNL